MKSFTIGIEETKSEYKERDSNRGNYPLEIRKGEEALKRAHVCIAPTTRMSHAWHNQKEALRAGTKS